MIIETMTDDGSVYHVSDKGLKLLQIETGFIYDEAYDVFPCPYTYEETEELIDPEKTEEIEN